MAWGTGTPTRSSDGHSQVTSPVPELVIGGPATPPMPPGDSDAERFSGLGESPRKPGRINERATAAIPDSGKVGRRVDLCPHLAGVEDVRAARLQPLDLVGA